MKKCMVPNCKNNENITPMKIFIPVSRNYEIRKKWCEAVGRKVTKSILHCCEDHFNLNEDSNNFLEYKISGRRLSMKSSIVPHLNIERPSSEVDFSQVSPSSKSRQKYITPEESKDNEPPKKKINIECPSTSHRAVVDISSTEVYVTPVRRHFKDIITSPAKSTTTEMSSTSTDLSASFSEYMPAESTEISSENSDEELKEISKRRIFVVLEKNSRFFLGLPQDIYFVVKYISEIRPLRVIEILITLKKIRLNDPYFRIAIDFGVSRSYVGSCFRKSLKILAEVFHQLIVWPSSNINKKFLPIAFRKRYANVNSIIDCFEISIEKPSNPEHQALTWSSYKNANTIKYLISCTPYGLINFISKGFGGRASDLIIVQHSGYLEKLPENVDVMADRGFKHLSTILYKKKCNLIRPPSVPEGQILTKEEALEGKRIASIRIHVERVISRIREFHYLSPHANIDIHSLGTLDAAVIIAAGIVNLQPTLIRW